MKEILKKSRILDKIYTFKNLKVMIDRDLAELYEVETRVLNQAVKRNIERFPEDFMFQLSKEEMQDWISQIVISNSEKMSIRRRPYVFTRDGILMLSNILKSEKAIKISIEIIRVFNRMYEIINENKDILGRLNKIENRQNLEGREIWKAIKTIQRKLL